MVGLLVRLSGVLPEIGFNLAVASWFAMTLLGAFGVVYDLVLMHKGEEASAGRGIRFGFVGALFAGVIGNLEGILELFYTPRLDVPPGHGVAGHPRPGRIGSHGQPDGGVLVVVARLARGAR